MLVTNAQSRNTDWGHTCYLVFDTFFGIDDGDANHQSFILQCERGKLFTKKKVNLDGFGLKRFICNLDFRHFDNTAVPKC